MSLRESATWILLLTLLLIQQLEEVHARQLVLGSADWKIRSSRYHLAGVSDARRTQGPVGRITGTRPEEVTLEPDPARALQSHMEGCIEADTAATAGFRLVIDRFKITDAVTGTRHAVSMDFNFKMVREIEGKAITVYESSIKPSMSVTGADVPAGFYEAPIRKVLKDFMEAFDNWSNESPLSPYFMNHVVVRFEVGTESSEEASEDTIRWSEPYMLTWKDFQGRSPENYPFSAQSNCVYTLKTIPEYHVDTIILTEIIQPIFTRKASWVKSEAHQDSLLMHEQLHFDICELYARRFRKELSAMPLGLLSFSAQIDELFGKTVKDYQGRQSDYDRETEHGIITEIQIRWMRSIRDELNELADFGTGKR